MSSNPLVSVIMIFLNGENFIEEAIESAITQTYPDWELLLVDDGSTDKSTQIAQHYAEQFPEKIRYLEHDGHQNRGMSASRNLGIYHAKGDYLGFLDCDDLWMPQKLEQQVAILEAHPEVALVGGRTKWWYSWMGNPEDQDRDFLQKFNLPLNSVISPPDLLIQFLKDEWASLCDILVRRHLVEKVGGYEESFRGMYEDQAFHAKLCFQFPAYLSSDCWYLYRQHPQACCSVSHTAGQTNVARRTFLLWLKNYLSEHSAQGTPIWKILQQELWYGGSPSLSHLLKKVHPVKEYISQLLTPIYQHLPIRWPNRPYPPVGGVRFGHLRQVTPISPCFGFDRGLPIDRYYIHNFLYRYATDIHGRVLEIGDDSYTRQFGGDRVITRDILHVQAGNSIATFVGDLTNADHIPSNIFDSLILTQTLQFIYNVPAAIQTIHRILKPGGVVLATVSGISHIDREWEDYQCWNFTAKSARQLFQEHFSSDHVDVETFGNCLTATSFLKGLCAEDLTQEELDYHDRHYELLITVRAVKPEAA